LDDGIGAAVYERASWLETRHIFAGSESPRRNGLKKAMPRAEGREMMSESWCAWIRNGERSSAVAGSTISLLRLAVEH